MYRWKWIVVMLALVLASCRSGAKNTSQAGGSQSGNSEFPEYHLVLAEKPANLGHLDLGLDQLAAFHGRFSLEFNGDTDWRYQVDLWKDGDKVAYQLSIQGVPGDKNPGDVRLVNAGGENFMSGPGTGDFCMRFPDSFRTEELFLGPEDFIHLDEFADPPAEVDSDVIAGINATQYTATTENHRGWLEVVVNYWVDPATNATLTYNFVAWGKDPLYQQGVGRIQGLFEVLEIGPQTIEAVSGCEIDFPMPGDAAEIIRLPGVIQFKTALGPVRMDEFYSGQLEPRGWVRQEPQINEQTQDGVLEYRSNGRTVTVDVEPFNPQNLEDGFRVEVFLEE